MHPRHPGRRRVELALELGQGRHDHRLLEGVRGRRQGQDPECESVVLARLLISLRSVTILARRSTDERA